jgi:hypothetical protein
MPIDRWLSAGAQSVAGFLVDYLCVDFSLVRKSLSRENPLT